MNPPKGPQPFRDEIQLQQWLDQEDAWMRDTVRSHGWAVQAVFGTGRWAPSECSCGCNHPAEGDSPPFAYTVGLFGFGQPELLIFGLPISTAHRTLNELGERVRRGQRLQPGELVTLESWSHRLHLFAFRDDAEVPVLISAQRFYGATRARPVPAIQCVWDDRWGRFPWEPGYDPPAALQPMPGTFRDGG